MEEPWLRGPMPGTSTFIAPLLMSFQMAREDLRRFCIGDAVERLWSKPHGLPSLGFQLRHIAGSVDRLSTYLARQQLSESQIESLRGEAEGGDSLEELLAHIDTAFARCEDVARGIEEDALGEHRSVGRKGLPTTAIGLIVHIAEHTQRHVGQAITTARLLNAMNRSSEID